MIDSCRRALKIVYILIVCLCYNALYDFVTISFIEQLLDGGIK